MQPSKRPARRHHLWWLTGLLALALAFAACGADDETRIRGSLRRRMTPPPRRPSEAELGDLETLPSGTDQLCGDKPIKLAQVDGFGANSWRKIVRQELKSELAPCTNVTISYAQAGGDIQKFNTQINSFVAQGYDIILVYDDFGEQGLPAHQQGDEGRRDRRAVHLRPGRHAGRGLRGVRGRASRRGRQDVRRLAQQDPRRQGRTSSSSAASRATRRA